MPRHIDNLGPINYNGPSRPRFRWISYWFPDSLIPDSDPGLGLLFMWQLAVQAFRNWPKASDFNDHLKRISLLALYFYLFCGVRLGLGWLRLGTPYQDVRSPVLIDRAGTPTFSPTQSVRYIRVLIIWAGKKYEKYKGGPKSRGKSTNTLCAKLLNQRGGSSSRDFQR